MSEQMPIGEWIEIEHIEFGNWVEARIDYMGLVFGVATFKNGEEVIVNSKTEWRYPTNPKDQLNDRILSDWRSQGLDYAHETWSDITKDWILHWMLDNGVSVE